MIIILIPAKPFEQAKTRLSPVLPPSQRLALATWLFEQTVTTSLTIGSVVVVISAGKEVRRRAKQLGAWAIAEHTPQLNPAIRQGIVWAQTQQARAILILPTDLPRLRPADLEAMLTFARRDSLSVVVAPCHHGTGTNALYLSPPAAITPQFGLNSFAAHQSAARAAGLSCGVFHNPGLAFDLDTPADWCDWQDVVWEGKSSYNPTNFTGFDAKKSLQ